MTIELPIQTPTAIPGQWVIRRNGDNSPEPYAGPGSHDEIFAIVYAWNRYVEHAQATQRNCAETPFHMERVKEAPSVVARRICPPMDRQPKCSAPARIGRAARARVGRFDSAARRRDVLARVVQRVNAGLVTVAGYLTQLGADQDTIRRYASQVGKRAKAAYAAKFGVEPARSGLAVVGRHLARVFAYDEADVEILRQAAVSYPKTSFLIEIGA